jgi:AraC-like DNA-binding protein
MVLFLLLSRYKAISQMLLRGGAKWTLWRVDLDTMIFTFTELYFDETSHDNSACWTSNLSTIACIVGTYEIFTVAVNTEEQQIKRNCLRLRKHLKLHAVNEVMYEVGYSDVKAFREVFRKITGISLLAYKEKYNKEVAE